MVWRSVLIVVLAFGLSVGAIAQQDSFEVAVSVTTLGKQPLPFATVATLDGRLSALADQNGTAQLVLPKGYASDSLKAQLLGYREQQLPLEGQSSLDFSLEPVAYALSEAVIFDRSRTAAAQATLRDVEGVAIYAGRKTELILPDRLQANLATNNAREIFKGVAGLNVWESDAGGLQLSIGARGLNPNRSSNFNTRQNGFDISADALGYPESYYTPPAQALARIELVRGAAGLQYGTQFGGLLNFELKKGPEKQRAALSSEQTVGSNGLFNSFQSVGGTLGRVSYYAFGQYKRGSGWRDNSDYAQISGHVNVQTQLSKRLTLGVELTRMTYSAKQPGGLLDFEFDQSPQLSKRSRNHFAVDWGLAAVHLDYEFTPHTKLNVRTFVLDALRRAVGELGPINRPDPFRERQIIEGKFRNVGQEIRLLHRYEIFAQPATLVVGTRMYSGRTDSRQGLGTSGSDADFALANPDFLEGYDYAFPSRNFAAFAEQLFNINERLSITPGVRYEYIRTASEGYYRQQVSAGAEILLDRQVQSAEQNRRDLLIGGLGAAYRINDQLQAYANASQNYRAINFSDLVVLNPNLLIDSTLSDERGSNAELGLRGAYPEGAWNFDASAFLLNYANRIGIEEVLVADPVLIEREVSMRTNVGRARLIGLEAFGEVDVVHLYRKMPSKLSIRPFLNVSLIHGRFLSGSSAVIGKRVELVPPASLRTGVSATWDKLSMQLLLTHVAQHYSDATNAERVADATRGTIPSYQVLDATASYRYRKFRLQAGINNLQDARYFTRRATGYPGPGIIPAQARTVYASLRFDL